MRDIPAKGLPELPGVRVVRDAGRVHRRHGIIGPHLDVHRVGRLTVSDDVRLKIRQRIVGQCKAVHLDVLRPDDVQELVGRQHGNRGAVAFQINVLHPRQIHREKRGETRNPVGFRPAEGDDGGHSRIAGGSNGRADSGAVVRDAVADRTVTADVDHRRRRAKIGGGIGNFKIPGEVVSDIVAARTDRHLDDVVGTQRAKFPIKPFPSTRSHGLGVLPHAVHQHHHFHAVVGIGAHIQKTPPKLVGARQRHFVGRNGVAAHRSIVSRWPGMTATGVQIQIASRSIVGKIQIAVRSQRASIWNQPLVGHARSDAAASLVAAGTAGHPADRRVP